MKISTYILTKNEEKYIHPCLESIKSVSDEIVIIDGYSTDKTIEICKEYTDKIYLHKFSGSFAEERMFAISKTQNSWILHIDADEAFSKDLINYIKNLKEDNEYDAYAFARRNYYDKEGKKWTRYTYFPDYQTRLFRKENTKYTRYVCEGAEVDGIIKYESDNLYICHYVPNKYALSNFKNQHLRSIKIQSKQIERDKPRIYYLLKIFPVLIHHFVYMFVKNKWYKDGYTGFKASFIMSLYIMMVNYYIIFDRDIILLPLKIFEINNQLQKQIDDSYKTSPWKDL